MPSNSFGNSDKVRLSIPFRPLTKGIRHDVPPTMIEQGALYDTEGAQMSDRGIERRFGFQELATISGLNYFRFLAPYMATNGDLDIAFISDAGRFGIYKPNTGTTTYYDAVYANPDTVTLAGTSGTDILTLATGSWYNTGLMIGDTITVDGDDYVINGFTSSLILTITTSLTATYSTTTWSGTYKNIGSNELVTIDYTQYLNTIIITDQVRPPLQFNGTYLTAIVIGARYNVGTVTIASDRLYYGNVTWIDNTPSGWTAANPVLVAWAETPGVLSSIDPESFYVHLPYVKHSIIKLKLLGNLLVSYFNKGIMIGQKTGYSGATLPYAFTVLETGERGIHNPYAVASSRDGNYYITTDDIYHIGNGLDFPKPIGTPIADLLSDSVSNYNYSILLNAPRRNFLYAFLITSGGTSYDTALVYNLTKQSWARFTLEYDKLAILSQDVGSAYSTLDSITTYSDLGATVKYSELSLIPNEGYLAASLGNTIYITGSGLQTDYNDTLIAFNIETGDLDFGKPDTQKTYKRFSVRFVSAVVIDIPFTLQASNDQGASWDELSTFTLVAGQMEAYANFLYTGPATRFRLSTSVESEAFIITEFVIDVQGRGLQYSNMS